MTERLADVSARIEGIRQLGAVVNAMKGIAAARAHAARGQIDAVDAYAATIAAAMSSVLAADGAPAPAAASGEGRLGLLVFCAEQGFAGAFSERVLDSLGDDLAAATLFAVGTRGQGLLAARGLTPFWTAALPSHSPGIPKLADRIARAIYAAVDADRLDRLDAVFTRRAAGSSEVRRLTLFPVDLGGLAAPALADPLMQLPPAELIAGLSGDYFHAQVCRAALHAFAAENEARLEAMTSAGSQIARELEHFQAVERQVRQEAITAEIIELGAGVAADPRGG